VVCNCIDGRNDAIARAITCLVTHTGCKYVHALRHPNVLATNSASWWAAAAAAADTEVVVVVVSSAQQLFSTLTLLM
jgi:hypothetical protein